MAIPLNLPPLDVPGLLRQHGLRPDKRLGQNFLLDPVALQRVTAAGEIGPEDVVLEVGPGLGSLTRYLAETARRVVVVELDKKLLAPLRAVLAPYQNVEVVAGDILKQKPDELMGTGRYLVVANIPYYITSAVIRHLLEAQNQPARMVLTVQLEVAQRICAGPGELSLLALSVQVYGQPKIAARIPAGAFYPAPKVDSAVVRIDLYSEPQIPFERLDVFFRLAKAGFAQRRKTLRNTLSAGLSWSKEQAEVLLAAAGVDQQRRAETLSIDEWGRLVKEFIRSD